jgi:hypothetical protein
MGLLCLRIKPHTAGRGERSLARRSLAKYVLPASGAGEFSHVRVLLTVTTPNLVIMIAVTMPPVNSCLEKVAKRPNKENAQLK